MPALNATETWQQFTTSANEYVQVKRGAVAFRDGGTSGATPDDGIVLSDHGDPNFTSLRIATGKTVGYRAVKGTALFVREALA